MKLGYYALSLWIFKIPFPANLDIPTPWVNLIQKLATNDGMQLIPKTDVFHHKTAIKGLQTHLAYSPHGHVNKEVKCRGFLTL